MIGYQERIKVDSSDITVMQYTDQDRPREITSLHRHKFCEIIFVSQGCCEVFSCGEHMALLSGGIALIAAKEVHAVSLHADCKLYMCHFDEAEVSKKTSLFLDAQAVETAEWYPGCMLSQSNEESPPHSRGKPKHSRSFQLLGMEKDHIQSILQALEEEQKRKGSGYVDMKRCYLEQMLIMLNRIRESQTRDAANCHSWKQDMVNAVLGQIEADIAAPFDFNAFAQSQGITPAYFRSIFKSIVNMSPTDYLNHVRISRALELLQVTSLSIAEIASRVGIYDANYFSRLFKKVTGYPPRYFKSIPDQE